MSFSISNVLSSVLSSIPSTDAYALKVRKVDNPQKSFYNWPVVQESGLIKVYHDAKNKQFECVMYTNSADGHETSAYRFVYIKLISLFGMKSVCLFNTHSLEKTLLTHIICMNHMSLVVRG